MQRCVADATGRDRAPQPADVPQGLYKPDRFTQVTRSHLRGAIGKRARHVRRSKDQESPMDGGFRDNDQTRGSRSTGPRAVTPESEHTPGGAPDDRAAHAATALPNDLPAYDVRRLMQGGGQAHLVLDGMAYTLRITRAGKLILTK
jgi:hemin uptake protein HemP